MQVEGIYTAEPRFEAQAKALKLKQEMAAAAAEEQKRLRGMPGLDLVETPKPLERQIRAEVEAKVKERAPEAVRQTQTSKVFAKPEVYDRGYAKQHCRLGRGRVCGAAARRDGESGI